VTFLAWRVWLSFQDNMKSTNSNYDDPGGCPANVMKHPTRLLKKWAILAWVMDKQHLHK
jgi:hypothetical protein